MNQMRSQQQRIPSDAWKSGPPCEEVFELGLDAISLGKGLDSSEVYLGRVELEVVGLTIVEHERRRGADLQRGEGGKFSAQILGELAWHYIHY